jgi:hypothetical protein
MSGEGSTAGCSGKQMRGISRLHERPIGYKNDLFHAFGNRHAIYLLGRSTTYVGSWLPNRENSPTVRVSRVEQFHFGCAKTSVKK